MKRLVFRVAVLGLGALSVHGACFRGEQARDPAVVVERFVAVTRNGDRENAYRLLGPRTRARLESALESAQRVSGRLELKAHDFLAVGRAPPTWESSSIRSVEIRDDRAHVSVHSADGDRHDIELVREDKAWKIELPGP